MSNFDRLKNVYSKNKYPILPIKTGMFLEIHENMWEWDTKRVIRFKGLVIKVKKPNHPDGTFTVRWEAARMTIEKIYPLSFPNFSKLTLLDDYKIRRSKLYYIRTKIWRDAKFKSVAEQGKKGIDLLALARNENWSWEENVKIDNVDSEKKDIDTNNTVNDVESEKIEKNKEEVNVDKKNEKKEEVKVDEKKKEDKE